MLLIGHAVHSAYNTCRFEDAFPGTPYAVVVDTIGGDYELRR